MSGIDLIPNDMKISQIRNNRKRLWIVISVLTFMTASGYSTVKYLAYYNVMNTVKESQAKYDTVQLEVEKLSQAKNNLDRWKDRIAVMDELGRYPDYGN